MCVSQKVGDVEDGLTNGGFEGTRPSSLLFGIRSERPGFLLHLQNVKMSK